jgi:hypothetical protein
MSGTNLEIQKLLQKYKSGTCTEEELLIVERWYEEQPQVPLDLLEPEVQADLEDIWQHIDHHIKPKKNSGQLKTWLNVAAVLIAVLFSFLGINHYYPGKKSSQQTTARHQRPIKPGVNSALLQLANGKSILLDSMLTGTTVSTEGIKITKTQDGQIACNSQEDHRLYSIAKNTITTPRGGQYALTLPDGSKAWLNASSSLTFPTNFDTGERRVTITGEVYFEIAKNEHQPFKVTTYNTEVRVLGTHFNVAAYQEDETVSTTLFEGAVELKNADQKIRIKPGQVSSWNETERKFETKVADLEEALAWKNGYFVFNEANIQEIMQKLSRWYDVPVTYKGDLSRLNFSAKISRKANIEEVLDILQSTGTIQFKIKERRVIVSR